MSLSIETYFVAFEPQSPLRTAVKSTASLVKTFCHEFPHFLIPNTKKFTGKLILSGEKWNKEKKWNTIAPFPLQEQFRRGKISKTKHKGTDITFFLFQSNVNGTNNGTRELQYTYRFSWYAVNLYSSALQGDSWVNNNDFGLLDKWRWMYWEKSNYGFLLPWLLSWVPVLYCWCYIYIHIYIYSSSSVLKLSWMQEKRSIHTSADLFL